MWKCLQDGASMALLILMIIFTVASVCAALLGAPAAFITLIVALCGAVSYSVPLILLAITVGGVILYRDPVHVRCQQGQFLAQIRVFLRQFPHQ